MTWKSQKFLWADVSVDFASNFCSAILVPGPQFSTATLFQISLCLKELEDLSFTLVLAPTNDSGFCGTQVPF